MTDQSLQDLKKELLTSISKGMGDILLRLKQSLPTESGRFSEFIQLESRLKEANKEKIKGVISQAELQLRYNQIRDDLIAFIQSLSVADFSEDGGGGKEAKQGSLLYNIPDRMQLEEEAKCVIRLAYDEDVIIENIELQPSVVLKTVRIAEVMQAELIDPAGEPNFAIRSLSSEEQFLEEGAYTEWIFYVKPLKAGTFPLMIKVSVVELIQGRERVREIVWEEQVEIVTEEVLVPAEVETLKPLGYRLQFGETEAVSPPMVEDVLESLDQNPQNRPDPIMIQRTKEIVTHTKKAVQRPTRSRRKNYLQPLLGLLILVSVTVYFLPSMDKQHPGDQKIPLVDSLKDSLLVYPPDSLAPSIPESRQD